MKGVPRMSIVRVKSSLRDGDGGYDSDAVEDFVWLDGHIESTRPSVHERITNLTDHPPLPFIWLTLRCIVLSLKILLPAQ
jgi:hypothetical protein